tara:strand:+ start:17400 stop:17702 length:303 start_codon:yes stop_codon:yes gene_type:complete
MAKIETLKVIESKGVNKRIVIFLVTDTADNSKFFIVRTKTLKDFKTRNILKTEVVYSVETFAVLGDLMHTFLNNSEVKNKLILKQLNDIKPFKARTNLIE